MESNEASVYDINDLSPTEILNEGDDRNNTNMNNNGNKKNKNNTCHNKDRTTASNNNTGHLTNSKVLNNNDNRHNTSKFKTVLQNELFKTVIKRRK